MFPSLGGGLGKRRGSKEQVTDEIVGEKKLDKRVTIAQNKAQKENSRTVKLLILGAGGSGKTTIRKQFSRLYANAFKDAKTRVELREIILHNLIEGMKVTIDAVNQYAGGFKTDEGKRAAATIKDIPEDLVKMTPDVVESFKILYKDLQVKDVLDNYRAKFQLQECFLPYFERVQSFPEWGGPIWIPSEDDCVRSRIRSSGIIEVDFEYDKTKFRVFDAGGQRAERRKWIHAFDDVTALIFVASMSEYDEVLFEDKNKNRLQETLEVWEELANSSHFLNVPILLFLNKLDLFREKYLVRKVPLNVSGLFPDAPNGEPNELEAINWLSSLFRTRRVKSDPSLLFVHTMAAVDATNVDNVFRDVKEIILLRVMGSQGLV